MKVILTGSTGYIGSAVMSRALAHPKITSVIVLSRKPLPTVISSPKLKVLLISDFSTYPPEILEELRGADACIWAIGTYNGNKVVEVDYPLAFMKAFSTTRSETSVGPNATKQTMSSGAFRYLHLGGAFTVAEQDANLWFMPGPRKVRGLAETKVAAFAEENHLEGKWESWVVKPGGVLWEKGVGSAVVECLTGTGLSIRVNELAAAMVETVVSGEGPKVLYTRNLVERGREALKTVTG
jgi:hypothetical protein